VQQVKPRWSCGVKISPFFYRAFPIGIIDEGKWCRFFPAPAPDLAAEKSANLWPHIMIHVRSLINSLFYGGNLEPIVRPFYVIIGNKCHLLVKEDILPLLMNRTVILELQEQGPGSILHYVDRIPWFFFVCVFLSLSEDFTTFMAQ